MWGEWIRSRVRHLVQMIVIGPTEGHGRTVRLAACFSAALIGFAVGWVCTTSHLSGGINWDTAMSTNAIGRGMSWSSQPWDSHYGVGQVYWLAMHVARFFGLHMLDGIRALNGLALGVSAAGVASIAVTFGLPFYMAVIVPGLYLLSWGTLLLAFTWEDNLLFHAPALTALAIAFASIGKWRWWHSIVTGYCVALSSLMSWQGAAYTLPIMYAAWMGGEGRAWWKKARDVVACPLAFVAGRFLWVLVYWATSHGMRLGELTRIAFRRPSPNYMPENLAGWVSLAGKPGEILRHAGTGVFQVYSPLLPDSLTSTAGLRCLGGILMAMAIAAAVLPITIFRKRVGATYRLLGVSFLALTLSSAVYLDLWFDKIKRFDFLPVFLGLFAAALVAGIRTRWKGRVSAFVSTGVLLAFLGTLAITAAGTHRAWFARIAPIPSIGHDHPSSKTWYAHLRSLRENFPWACGFVFAYSELSAAKHHPEIGTTLYSEVPHPMVLGAPDEARSWRNPLPLYDTNRYEAERKGCEWLSPGARSYLATVAVK